MDLDAPTLCLLNGSQVDLALTITIAALTIVLTVWGAFVSNPTAWHKVWFSFLGVVLLMLIAWQTDRTSDEQKQLKIKIDQIKLNTDRSTQLLGFMQVVTVEVPTISAPLLSPGVPNLLNVSWANRGSQPISDVKHLTKLKLERSRTDADVFEEFEEEVRRTKAQTAGDLGPTISPGQEMWVTLNFHLTEDDIASIMKGTSTLYLLGHSWWSGHADGVDHCFKLMPPGYYPLKAIHTVWMHCKRKKSISE